MNTKQKAKELVKSFNGYVYPYLGSGFMTNTPDNDVILMMSKECAKIAVNEILSLFKEGKDELHDYYSSVLKEIDNLTTI